MSDNKQKKLQNGYDLDGLNKSNVATAVVWSLASRLAVVASGMLFGLALTSGDEKIHRLKKHLSVRISQNG